MAYFTGLLESTEGTGYQSKYGVTTYGRLVSPPVVASDGRYNEVKRDVYTRDFYFYPSKSTYVVTYGSTDLCALTGLSTFHVSPTWILYSDFTGGLTTTGANTHQYLTDDRFNSVTVQDHSSLGGTQTGSPNLMVFRSPIKIPDDATINHVRVFKAYVGLVSGQAPTGATNIVTYFALNGSSSNVYYTGNYGDRPTRYFDQLNGTLDTGDFNQSVEYFTGNPKTNATWKVGDVELITGGYQGIKVTSAGFDRYAVAEFSVGVSWTYTGISYTEVTDAAGYEIGITPDLGWPNVGNMFADYEPGKSTHSNTKLTKQVFDGTGWYYDFDRQTLRVAISEDTMQQALAVGYPEYLWAVRSYDQFGTKSEWSEFRRFYGVYEQPSEYFSILNDLTRHCNPIITLFGKKHPSIERIEVDEDTGLTTYNGIDSWKYNLSLTGGLNEVYIRGIPSNGRPTAYLKAKIVVPTGQSYYHPVYNTFDDFGALHGVDRIRAYDEGNVSYKARIKDAFNHPSDSNLLGLHYAIARDLDLDYDDAALVILPHTLPYSGRIDLIYPDITMDICTNSIYFFSPSFIKYNEYHKVDPQDLSFKFDLQPYYGVTPVILNENNVEIPSHEYEIDTAQNKVKFYADKHLGTRVYARYCYSLVVPIGENVSLSEIKSYIEALTFANTELFTVTLSSSRRISDSSDGLLRGRYRIRSTQRYRDDDGNIQVGVRVRWTDLSIHSLIDKEFLSRYLNEDGTYINSKIEGFIAYFNDKAHHTWDKVVPGKDVWDPIDEEAQDYSILPNVLDPLRGYWKSSAFNHQHRFTTAQALDRGFISELDGSYLQYIGLKHVDFKCGIGYKDDLKVVISQDVDKEILAPPGVYRSTVSWYVTGQVTDSKYLPNTIFGGILFKP